MVEIIDQKQSESASQTNKNYQKPKGNYLQKAKKLLKTFPKKHHFEYISTLLSIPVLISVIALNLMNIESNKIKPDLTPTPTPKNSPIFIDRPEKPQPTTTTSPTTTPTACIKKVGPISIDYPADDQTVSDNPLCFTISYDNSDYCSVVWSYKINNGSWSNYNSNVPCIYNPPQGNNTFSLRVQSTADQTQKVTLTRQFIYSSDSNLPTPTITTSPTATSSSQ